MPYLSLNQQCQSTDGNSKATAPTTENHSLAVFFHHPPEEGTLTLVLNKRAKMHASTHMHLLNQPSFVEPLQFGLVPQSIGPKPDSRPHLEGARYQVPDKLLMPVYKRPQRMGPE